MYVISVNIGRATVIENAKASGRTGIYKLPVGGPARITSLGLAGDAICDTRNHGGVDQAVYVYGAPDYAWWSAALGQDLAPGTFGENLTLSDLESATLSVGDRLHLNEVVLEVTSPRIPCVTLAVRMGDPSFARKFRAAERPGLYCRVIREGYVQAGEAVTLEPYTGSTLTALQMFRDHFNGQWDEATIRRHLAAPIALRDRVDLEGKLAGLLAG